MVELIPQYWARDYVQHLGRPGRWRVAGLAARLPGRDIYRLVDSAGRTTLAQENDLVLVLRRPDVKRNTN